MGKGEALEAKGITGQAMMQKAIEWRSNNLSAWSEMKRMADRLAAEGRRFSIDQLAIEARYNMRTNGCSDGFKINNTLRAPLARMLVRESPHVSEYIECRPSKVDQV